MLKKKDKNVKKEYDSQLSWKQLLNVYKNIKIPWLLIILSGVMVIVLKEVNLMLVPYQTKIMTGAITENGFLAGFILLSASAVIVEAVQGGINELASIVTARNTRQVVWKKMLRLPMSFYDKLDSQELVSRVTQDTTDTYAGMDEEDNILVALGLRLAAGMSRNDMALSTWFYGAGAMDGLSIEEQVQTLRDYVREGHYLKLLQEIDFFGDNSAVYTLVPSLTKREEDERKEQEELSQIRQSMSKEAVDEIKKMNESLREWQNAKPDEKILASIPHLQVSDLKKEPSFLDSVISEDGNVKVIFHPAHTAGIIHTNLYFSLADCTVEEMQVLSVLTNLLGALPTAEHSMAELERKIKQKIGALDYNVVIYSDLDHENICRPYFEVSFSVLQQHWQEAVALIAEILDNTLYEGEAEDYIYMTLLQCSDSLYRTILQEGNHYAMLRAG